MNDNNIIYGNLNAIGCIVLNPEQYYDYDMGNPAVQGVELMHLEFTEINNKEQIDELSQIAAQIWLEYFPGIITLEQVDYMIERYQSANAITRQVSHEGYKYFMVSGDNDIIGYIAIKAEADKLFLSKLYIKKEFRGKGYFSRMLLFIELIAREKGLHSLYLTVNKHNSNSIDIYLHKGFLITKEQVTDIGNGFVMDDYVMEKVIIGN